MNHIITYQECNEEFSKMRQIERIWRKVTTKGRVWLYPVNVPNPGDHIHVWTPPKNPGQPEFRGFPRHRGYGGSTLKFTLEDGSVLECDGPWHSNGEALKKSTGIDLTDKHVSFVVVSREIGQTKATLRTIMKDVLYSDTKPHIGKFNRGDEIAKLFVNQIGDKVYLYSKTDGGSSNGSVRPDEQEERI